MSGSLFRKEAVEHHKDRLMGEVLLVQPLSLRVMTGIIALIAVLIITYLFLGTFSRKETVGGLLMPDKGIVKLYAPNPGFVDKMLVEEGQHVEAGQEILTIHSERLLEGGGDVEAKLLEELEKSENDLLTRIEGENTLRASETNRLNKQIASIESELQQINDALKIQQERVEISKKRVEDLKKLREKGAISQTDYQKVYEEFLQLQQAEQDIKRNKAIKENQIEQAKTELQQLPLQSRSRISDLEKAISEIRQRALEASGRRSYEVRAPVAGIVTGLLAKQGQWQGNGMQLMAIIPEGSVLQAEMYVPTRAIGFLEEGLPVRLRYHAFPHQRYGVHEGRVLSIAKHILHPKELTVPLETQEPVYRVIVDLDEQFIKAYGKEVPLQAGMTFEADIILDRQSIIDWVLDPLYSLKGKM